MLRFFIDSSVLFAAVYSSHGHAHDLIILAVHAKIILVVSHLVLEEAKRNLAQSYPEKKLSFDLVMRNLPVEIVLPSRQDVINACKVVILKDAPIIAAAKLAKVDGLVSLDKKHILNHPEINIYINAPVYTPMEAYEKYLPGSDAGG